MRRLVSTLIALCVGSFGVVVAAPVGAVDNGEWAVIPTSEGELTSRSSFAFDLDPGTSIEDSVTIQNLTEDPLSFRIYPADAFNPSAGGLSVQGPDAPVTDAGSWITLATNEWELPGGLEVEIPFTVAVPLDATPGDYAAGIVALDRSTEATGASGSDDADIQLDVQRAVAVLMFIRISGALAPSLVVTDLSVNHDRNLVPGSSRSTAISLTITNNGNVRLSPEVTASLDALGPGGISFEGVVVENLLPGSSRIITLDTDGGPIAGPATARVVITAEGVTIERSQSFWSIPWLVVIALVSAILGTVMLRRRRRRNATNRLSRDALSESAAPALTSATE